MFDFEKLDVYAKVKELNVTAFQILSTSITMDEDFVDRLKTSNLNILLELTKGTGRKANKDKVHFYTSARTYVFEAVALLDLMKDLGSISEQQYNDLYEKYEQVSKMILGMIRSFTKSTDNIV